MNNQKGINVSEELRRLSDKNLYSLCKTYGARALEWRRKFIGLLPEVNRRRLYEKKGFESIFVFAKKLAGLSENQVRLALNLEKRFEGMPELRGLLVNGEVSVNKLTRVASIASAENEKFLAGQVRILSQGAVETLVRDGKFNGGGLNAEVGGNQNGLFKPKSERIGLRVQTLCGQFGGVNLSLEVHQKLFELQQKGFDLNQMILGFLKKREEEIAQKKAQITEEVLRKEEERKVQITENILQNSQSQKLQGLKIDPWKAAELEYIQRMNIADMKGQPFSVKKSRSHIPTAVRRILHEEHGTKCSIKSCQKAATTIHHTQRFSLSGSHDPHYLALLCKNITRLRMLVM